MSYPARDSGSWCLSRSRPEYLSTLRSVCRERAQSQGRRLEASRSHDRNMQRAAAERKARWTLALGSPR